MNRILVVEDEKMIRKGIVAMIKRCPVEVEEVIECHNGEEALNVLESGVDIDVMFTDIRMPKMDGIELIKRVNLMESMPKIVVISGYDDFNYAVEALRQGVSEYLLKPLEREKLASVLMKLEKELETSKDQNTEIKRIANQQLKYLLLNKNIATEEIDAIEKSFYTLFPDGKYRVCCFNSKNTIVLSDTKNVLLNDVEGFVIIIVEESKVAMLFEKNLQGYSVGISELHEGIRELKDAYVEAVEARKEAFVKSAALAYYGSSREEYEAIPDNFAELFIQLVGTDKTEESLVKFGNIQFKARIGKIAPEKLLQVTHQILDELVKTYERVIEMDIQGFKTLQNPLAYNTAQDYYVRFEEFIKQTHQLIKSEFDDYKNKEKINMAIYYIRENYRKDLNMAVVSNHISMNYSLFSLNFKQYTGMNFVNYLKKIRIEKAKELLEQTDDKIINISQSVGYDNEKHFMKIFKSVCGVSPSEYRKNVQLGKKSEG